MVIRLSTFIAVVIAITSPGFETHADPESTGVISDRFPIRTNAGTATATHFLSPRTGLGFIQVDWSDGHTVNSAISAIWKLEVGDLDGDGVDELVLGTWSSRGAHTYLTRRTIWILSATREQIEPLWRGSMLPDPFDDFEVRRRHGRDFLVTHPTGPGLPSTIYHWTGFGFAVDERDERPPIRLAFVGDVAIARYEGSERIQVDPTSEALQATAHADVVIANLETTVSDAPDGAGALRPTLQVTETDLDLLARWRIDAVTRANNHVMDAGTEGWDSTSRALTARGLKDLTNTRVSLGNQNLSIVAVTLHPARFSGPRILAPGDDDDFVAELASQWKAPGSTQLNIVSLHGGAEGMTAPTPRMESLSYQLLENGADVVVWHGSHAPAGVEKTAAGIVAWGLGDFALKRKNLGCTLHLELERHGKLALATGPNSCKE